MATEPELNYLAKHPGGFDRESLEEFVPRTIGEWATHRGLTQPEQVVVTVILRGGERLAISGARAALTWIVFFTEADTARLVPYSEIVGIDIARRTGPPPKNPVGFGVERVDEGATR